MGKIVRCVVILCLIALAAPAVCQAGKKTSVVFASPGSKDDPFFGQMVSFMQAAAEDLGFELDVYYGDRNHVLIDENVKHIFNRRPLPDYVIGMNARGSGREMVEKAEALGVKLIFINQSFLGGERLEMGLPGTKYKNWLFELLPNDVHAGYLLAKTLIDAKFSSVETDKKISIIAINGLHDSPASILRIQGFKKALAEHPNVLFEQELYAKWKRDVARAYTLRLLERYPDASIVWSASDVMALGVADGIGDYGKIPGKDVLTGGVDWAAEGLTSVKNGLSTASVGGHFMEGGWALVMLYDYIHGVPVPNQSKSFFSVLTADNVQDYITHFGDGNWSKVNFLRFSKAENPDMLEYPFGLAAILEQVKTQ